MSDNDKQLTVAELLARERQEQPGGSDRSKRRRRRSLEEGGISVAELTGSFPKVEARPQESRHSAVPIDAPEQKDKTEQSGQPKRAEKSEQPKRAEKSVQPDKEEKQPEKWGKPEEPEQAEESEQPEQPAEEAEQKPSIQDANETSVMPAVAKGSSAAVDDTVTDMSQVDVAEEDTADRSVDQDEDQDQDEADGESYRIVREEARQYEPEGDGEGLNIPVLVGMILGGLILGVVVFLGFEWLWSNLNALVVAVLAVVVTVIMIVVVKALRTERDGLMMTISGIVGVLMTFGPGLVTLL